MSVVRIERIDTPAALEDLKSVWLRFEGTDSGASLFQSWTWNRIWCQQVLAHRKRARLAVRVARDGAGRILAILPLFELNLAGSAIQLTQFISHGMSNDGGILTAEPDNTELTAAIVAALFAELPPRTILHLTHLSPATSFTRELLATGRAAGQCPRVWVEADATNADPAARLSSKMRKNLRSARNRLEREFKTELEVVSGPGFEAAFIEFAQLHQQRFAELKKRTSLAGQDLAFLQAAATELSKSGRFEILRLRADGNTIAAQLMARDRQRYYAIQAGFASEFGRFSPVYLLDLEAMRRGFQQLGCTIYDFGAGYEPYKYHWKPSIGTDYFCCCGAPNFYARAAAAAYRFAFKRTLPSLPADLAWNPGKSAK